MAGPEGPDPDLSSGAPPAGPRLPLLHLDDRLAAVHKPSGIHTHPSALSPGEDSAARWLGQQLGRRVWPVHRLDRGASGILLFALSEAAAGELIGAFRERRVAKRYLALVRGWPARDGTWLAEGVVDRPLRDADPASREPREQEALTRWRSLARAELPVCTGRGGHAFPTTRVSLLECRPETGRMHQIRRHLAGLGHPLLGDNRHGDRHLNRALALHIGLERLALVCVDLELPGADGLSLRLGTALDPDLRRVLARLGMSDPTAGRPGPPLFDGVLLNPGRGWRARAARRGGARVTVARREDVAGAVGAGMLPGGLAPWDEESGAAPHPCPMCATRTRPFHQERGRRWRDCPVCALVHRERDSWPAAAEAEARWRRHENRAGDAGYRAWLAPLARAVAARVPPGSRGLDAGCGPATVLAHLLADMDRPAAAWDPVFAPARPAPPPGGWHFITLCEVFEHLERPRELLAELAAALRPGGWLVLSTGVLEEDRAFPGWWYARDLTHLVFARPSTLGWLAAQLGLDLAREGRLVLFRRPAGPHSRELP